MRPATLLCIVMLFVTLAVFARTANHDFINFDDTIYVTDDDGHKITSPEKQHELRERWSEKSQKAAETAPTPAPAQ